MEPATLWEKTDEAASGMRLAVRAATFSVDGEPRSGITVTVVVPDGYVEQLDGGVAATLLLNPDEAVGMSAWLSEASAAAMRAAPPLYG